jgi:lipoyl(octanoyl) transferase
MNKPEWRISDGVVPYAEALTVMEQRVADIRAGRERELVWLLELRRI